MAQLPKEEVARYAHSLVHSAVANKDHTGLRRIILGLPQLAQGGKICTEEDAIAEEQRAEVLSKELDRRDVPGRETPLHLAVRMRDAVAAEMLLAAGADPNLQNEQGWSALQEAICAREEAIACLMTKYYPAIAWAKWCRRMPRIIGTMKRMRDFYMEVTFHFESSVIPFIGKVAPSDTYRIWKKGSNLRADMTIAGFDGFKIKRSDQSFLFLGEGSKVNKLQPGSLCMLKHKRRCILNALDGADKRPTECEAAWEVAELSRTNMYRPGLDVTQAVLLPQLTWRRQEQSEMVGKWKAKVYDMHHVQLSLKSRRVPGALTDEELFGSGEFDAENGTANEKLAELLDEEERRQLEKALDMQSEEDNDGMFHDAQPDMKETKSSSRSSVSGAGIDAKDEKQQIRTARNMESAEVEEDSFHDARQTIDEVTSSSIGTNDAACVSSTSGTEFKKKAWVGFGRHGPKQNATPPRMSYSGDEKASNLFGDDRKVTASPQRGRMSVDIPSSPSFGLEESNGNRKDKNRVASTHGGASRENEYTMGVRPVLWLTPNFPLKTEEMLPLLDILANKVKAVRRLREVLTTKLPAGTFPVKLAIPVVPTIRVVITFTKFEHLAGDDAFATARGKDSNNHGSSWFSWRKGATSKVVETPGIGKDPLKGAFDPFAIPDDYVWKSYDARKHGRRS